MCFDKVCRFLFFLALFIYADIFSAVVQAQDILGSLDDKSQTLLKLDFGRTGVDSAMFSSNGMLWIVFDGHVKNNIAPFLSQFWVKSDYNFVMQPSYSVLKIKTDKVPYLFQGENGSWLVDFERAFESDAVLVAPEKGSDSIFLPISKPKVILNVIDADSGDELIVVPGNHYLGKTYKHVHFDLLESNLGIVVQVKSDGVDVFRSDEGIEVYYPEVQSSILGYSKDNLSSPIYGLRDWVVNPKDYHKLESRLQNQIMFAEGELRFQKRLDLVRFFMANGSNREAYSYLQYMKFRDFTVESNYAFNLFRYASMFLNRDWIGAYQYYKKINLNDFDSVQQQEIKTWMSASLLMMGKEKEIMNYEKSIMDSYVNRDEFALLALQSAIKNRDDVRAKELQEMLLARELKGKKRNDFRLLLAKILLLQGDEVQAFSLYDKVFEDVEDLENRMKAVLAKTRYLYENMRYTSDDVVNELNKVRVLWRGNFAEANLREWLGEVLVDNGSHYEGLSVLMSLYKDFPAGYNIFSIMTKMSDVFAYLFVENGVSGMHPFLAITLFMDFQDLLPIGSNGVKATLLFVDYLLKLDLMDYATSVLSHLIKYRLGNDYKFGDDVRLQQIIRLAKIYIMDHRFTAAVSLLDEYDVRNLDADRVKSYALMKSERYPEAIEVISEDDSREADFLRSDVFWIADDWYGLIKFGESKLEFRPNPKEPLSVFEVQLVFRLATAYITVADKLSLLRLYNAFKGMMDNNLVYKDTFDAFYKMAALYNKDNSYVQGISELVAQYTKSLADPIVSDPIESD